MSAPEGLMVSTPFGSNVTSITVKPAAEEPAGAAMMIGTRLMLRRSLAALHAAVGVGALVGGVALLRDASGGGLGLTTSDLSAFTSFTIPAVLLLMFGAIQIASAYVVTRPGAHAVEFSHYAGALIVLWTAFQIALIAPLHPMQLVLLIVGTYIYSVAAELHREEPHTPMLP